MSRAEEFDYVWSKRLERDVECHQLGATHVSGVGEVGVGELAVTMHPGQDVCVLRHVVWPELVIGVDGQHLQHRRRSLRVGYP